MIFLKRRWLGCLRLLRDCINLVSSFSPSCTTSAYHRAGLWWALKICLLKQSVPCGVPGPCRPLLVQCLICSLCALLPNDCPPVYRHLTAGPLHSEPPLPKAIKMQQLGDRAKWLWKIALRLLISGVCRFVLFFPFAVAQEPKHPPLISYTVKWPGPMPGCFARWLGRGGCCMRWADNTPQCCKQDTPPSRSHPASAPAACCFVMACHDMGVSSQIGEPIALLSSPFPKSERGTFQK